MSPASAAGSEDDGRPPGGPVRLPLEERVAGTGRFLVVDTCALLDLVRTEVVDGRVTALEQHEPARRLLRLCDEGSLAIMAPERVHVELDRLRADELQGARDRLEDHVERQRRLFATLARFGLADAPGKVRVDGYVETVGGMLEAWRRNLHRLPGSDAAAAAALARVDRGEAPSRTVRDVPGERASTRNLQLWDCLILETVFEALDAVDRAGHARDRRLFLSSDGRAFGTARVKGSALHREFEARGLHYVATFAEALSALS